MGSLQAPAECKLSVRITPGLREDVKAVASLSGKSMDEWVIALIRGELKRMEKPLRELRAALPPTR